MPTGALIQLNAYGAQNQYLNGNPQFTYFRGVFRRHTNFSMELIELTFTGPNELSQLNPIRISTNIDRNGDLASHMYFLFDLPDIYSGYNPNVSFENIEKSGYKFRWINSIGTNIINLCRLSIGGQIINDLYGEWIRIWHELFSNVSMRNFDQMIGNIPDLFTPENTTASAGVYPTSTLSPEYSNDPELFTSSQYISNPYLKPPSISGRTITVPLNFWFTQNPGLALPLIALQYHTVVVDIELKPLASIYTINDNDESSLTFGQRIVPDATKPAHSINNFITHIPADTFVYGQDFSALNTPYSGWGLHPRLQVNYIFLDEDERKRFADVSHEYLIEQVIRQDFIGITGNYTLKLNLQNPVKEMVWMATRSDFEDSNIYGNYTNWPISTVSPGSLSYVRNEVGETQVTYVRNLPVVLDTAYQAYQSSTILTKFNQPLYKQFPISQATLWFNGQERFETRNADYFQNLQVYQNTLPNWYEGVQIYSFALDPMKYQPSGACNMSRVHDVELRISLTPVTFTVLANGDTAANYNYNVYVYSVNYNIFRILSGMGGLAFTS